MSEAKNKKALRKLGDRIAAFDAIQKKGPPGSYTKPGSMNPKKGR